MPNTRSNFNINACKALSRVIIRIKGQEAGLLCRCQSVLIYMLTKAPTTTLIHQSFKARHRFVTTTCLHWSRMAHFHILYRKAKDFCEILWRKSWEQLYPLISSSALIFGWKWHWNGINQLKKVACKHIKESLLTSSDSLQMQWWKTTLSPTINQITTVRCHSSTSSLHHF